MSSDLRFTFTAGDESFEVVEFTLHEGLSETFRFVEENSLFGSGWYRNGLVAVS
ncbi:hypothetical protein ACN8ZM_36155 [Burkholderia aenigmatica]|uniref:hypothetical protein n=1 Tax=Burkholderia aenigmatica TaxID=2015348 RepID=UPI003B438A86